MGLNLEGQLAEGHLSREQDGKVHFTGSIPVDFLKEGGEVVMIPKARYEELRKKYPVSLTRCRLKMSQRLTMAFPGRIELEVEEGKEPTKLYLSPYIIHPLEGEEIVVLAYESVDRALKNEDI